nr:prolyl oligopeptidase family serine peptidase [Opitutaceae bacterium]
MHRLILVLIISGLIPSVASAAGEFRFIADVDYLAPGRTEKLDLYLPDLPQTATPLPAMVWIHGLKGDKGEKRGRNICETLAAAGYVCVSLNHGPDRELKGNLLDCKNAVRFLRTRAKEYNIDPTRIAVMGGSMGGYHALMVGFTAGVTEFEPTEPYPGVSSAVRTVVDFYGPLGPQGYRVTDYITPNGPPVLIFHGEADTKVPPSESIRLAEALTTQGVAHQLLLLPAIGHTFRLNATWVDKPLPQNLGPVLMAFLRQIL